MSADLHFDDDEQPQPAAAGVVAEWRVPTPHGDAVAEAAAGGEVAANLRIGDRLVELGLISDDQLGVALFEQKRSDKMLGEILVEFGFITEGALLQVEAKLLVDLVACATAGW